MNELTPFRRGLLLGGGAVALVAAFVIAAVLLWPRGAEPDAGPSGPVGAETPAPDAAAPDSTPTPTPRTQPEGAPPEAGAVPCEGGTVVDSADALQTALDGAGPGDVIRLAPGTYDGYFTATASGTADQPITLCGPSEAVLDGGDTEDSGYVFHLDGASYWVLAGFTVTNGQKGVMADGTVGTLISGLTVHRIGDEAIHLRGFSTDNVVSGNTVHDTGNRREKFGEGIYIGTAESNWCDITDCEPDRSDRNRVIGNTIYDTTAESIDIKEGTTGGVVEGNTFDGASLVEDDADSWVDVKGNGWVIAGNTGVHSPVDGFQTHEILDGWGTDNVFRDNTATVDGSGFGFSLTPVLGNTVECGNTVSGADEGFANVDCVG